MQKSVWYIALLFLTFSNAHAQTPNVNFEKTPLRVTGVQGTKSVASPDYDVSYYRCEWNVDPAVRYIKGVVTSYFTVTSGTASITFDLSKALTVDSVRYHGSNTAFVQTNSNSLQVNFPALLPQGRFDSLTIFYKGIPASGGFGSFIQTVHSGTPVLWTLSEPYGAPDWWPCKDVLTDKADSIDIILTYPAAYRSSSNGVLVAEQTSDGVKQDHWKHRYPIASYLVAIAVTNYNMEQDSVQLPSGTMPVVMYAYPEQAAQFKSATATAKACLQTFSSLLGEYPFHKERYAQTQFGWGGGMEHQTNSFIVSPQASLVAHELGHQWFGDMVTTGSWRDLWLNEGFATYLELIFAQYVQHASSQSILQQWQNTITKAPDGSVIIPDTTNTGRLFNGRLTYNKGAYVLHMLRWKLGDSAFFRGLRQYLNDPALQYKTARTADLQRHLEQVGGQYLADFFSDWVVGEGYPSYNVEWGISQTNGITVRLSQTTSHASVPFFEMPVPLQFKNAANDTIITVNHTRNGEIFNLRLPFRPDTMLIDPQLWILSKNNTTVKKEVLPEAKQILLYPNPASGVATLFLPASPVQLFQIRLFNVLGQQVYSQAHTSGGNEEIKLPVQQLSAGIYWVQVVGSEGINVTKPLRIFNR